MLSIKKVMKSVTINYSKQMYFFLIIQIIRKQPLIEKREARSILNNLNNRIRSIFCLNQNCKLLVKLNHAYRKKLNRVLTLNRNNIQTTSKILDQKRKWTIKKCIK